MRSREADWVSSVALRKMKKRIAYARPHEGEMENRLGSCVRCIRKMLAVTCGAHDARESWIGSLIHVLGLDLLGAACYARLVLFLLL